MIATGSGPWITARYAGEGVEVGDGSEVEVGASVGLAWGSEEAEGQVDDAIAPGVGLEGKVVGRLVGVARGGNDVFFGVQLARAAPATAVAVSLMNVRRERDGRRFIGILL